MSDRVILQDRFVAFATTSGNDIVVDGDAPDGTLRVLSGTTSTNYGVVPAGAFTLHVDASGVSALSTASVACTTHDAGGSVWAPQFTTLSDARLKTDVQPVTGALAAVERLRGVEYTWADGRPTMRPGVPEVGFLAQEVSAVLPACVVENAEGVQAVAYDRLAPVLVGAVQELLSTLRATAASVADLRSTLLVA